MLPKISSTYFMKTLSGRESRVQRRESTKLLRFVPHKLSLYVSSRALRTLATRACSDYDGLFKKLYKQYFSPAHTH